MKFATRPRLWHVATMCLVWFTVSAVGRTASACPFCSAVSQTLRQEMAAMDAVVIAEAFADSKRNKETGEVPLRVIRVLKGDKLIKPGTEVQTVYYGSIEPGRRFMMSGVEPQQLMWSSPLPVDERAEEYLAKALSLPDDSVERLRFYRDYLQDESSMLARDAYDEFAIAPYGDLLQIKEELDHDQLVEWVKDPEMPADRRRLYLVMLSVCGDSSDLPMLESMLRSTQQSARSGLDALIACYLTLAGSDGLDLVEELFLANKQAPYADTYGAIMAIRFHGTETDVIPRAELVQALHHVLDRPDLADLVIPDLARWGDWTQIDRLVELYKSAEADNNWIRVPVVNYMRACPLPEAAKAMETLRKIDPEAVKRANTFFSAPVPPADKPASTSSLRRPAQQRLAQQFPAAPRSGQLLASAAAVPESAVGASVVAGANPMRIMFVLATAASSLMILAYLVISGGPQPRAIPVRVDAGR